MTDSDGTSSNEDIQGVRDVHGPVKWVNTAKTLTVKDGPENHIHEAGIVILSENGGRERRKRAQPLSHSAGERTYLQERFLLPPEFDRAADNLRTSGIVFISGNPGSGRQSTAKMLLWSHFSNNDAHYRRLTLDVEDDETPLDPNSVQPNELLLLDLSMEDEEKFEFVRMLGTLRSAVERNDAALVVVLPGDWEASLGTGFNPRVEITRPSGEAVLREHLKRGGVLSPEKLPDELNTHMATSPMCELERLAERISEAADKSPEAGLSHWVREATQAISNDGETVTNQVRHCDPQQRALLLAAAMLEDAHADSAYTARNTLLDKLKFPEDERHVLERAGLDESLRGVHVEPTPTRRIQFRSVRYAEAVRDHFWTNYPELREPLRDWVDGIVGQHDLTDDDRDHLVARFSGQARRTGRVDDLCFLARRWTNQDNHRRSRLAASALAYGLQDDANAGKVRRQIYDWSSPDQTTELARVLVLVCKDVMADTHPERALVRLRRLAGHRDVDVRQSAQAALKRLAEDNRFYRRFLWRMVGWLENPKRADIELFFAISPADRLLRQGDRSSTLIRNNTIQCQLIACWRAVFGFDDTVWQHAVRDCFASAATSPDGDRLLDILVEATDQERYQLAKLHVSARDWAAQNWGTSTAPSTTTDQPVTPDDVRRQLAVRIDRAQNLRLQHQEKPC